MRFLAHAWTLLVYALAVSGCVRVPDFSLARRAAAEGDQETARWHLQELAGRGYAAAWIDLGDMARPHDSRRAAHWYRQALGRDPRAALRLARLQVAEGILDEEGLRALEQELLEAAARGNGEAFRLLVRMYASRPDLYRRTDVDRAIAAARAAGVAAAGYGLVPWYRGNGTFGEHLPEIKAACQQNLEFVPACFADLARVSVLSGSREGLDRLLREVTQRYHDGRLSAEEVVAVADTLAEEDAGPGLAKDALALYGAVAGEDTRAMVRQARLILRFPFLAEPGRLLALVKQIRQKDPDQGNLLMGRIYYEGRQVPRDPVRAEQCFLAAAGRLPAACYYLGRIYGRGYLGRPDHRRALAYLLAAARSGVARADLALAEMFVRGRGIRANPVYGLLFASLAADRGLARAVDLRDRLQQAASPDQKQQAGFLLEQEEAWRRTGR